MKKPPKKRRWLLPAAAIALLVLFFARGLIFQWIFRNEWPSQTGRDVPVLMYHAVGEEPWGEEHLFVRPAELEAQLICLQEQGYETITFPDLAHLEDYEKPILLTFDDGYEDNYTEVFPLLRKYQAKATIFIIPGNLGLPHFLTEDQVKELSASGLVSIQSHSQTHPQLTQCGMEQLFSELKESRDAITGITGIRPIALSYPNGLSSPLTRRATKLFYAFGVRIGDECYRTGRNAHAVPRLSVVRGMSTEEFAALIAAPSPEYDDV